MSYRVGIDIGGTFTDFALLDDSRARLVIHKQLTTPRDPAAAILSGLPILLAKAGVAINQIEAVVHGTTLVTNAIIERRGAVTGMLCTAGFSDVLEIAMERRYDMYDLRITYPQALVSRGLRREVEERIAADGSVARSLNPDQVQSLLRELVEGQGVEALAVCLLNSYLNPSHEEAIREQAQVLYPWLPISISADVFPFMREYERWTTTTMNAFTQPLIEHYLAHLEDGLGELGFKGCLYIMASSGGTLVPVLARRYPVRMLESGPAAGVLIAGALGRRLERSEWLAFDMGGTTAKGALIRDGKPLKRYEMEVGRVHEFKVGSGLPAKIPVLDLIEIGAGGGSLAKVDVRGMIQVGPRSAGADPGPACYNRGGREPTLTDANLILGYLDASSFLGGEMALSKDQAVAAIERVLAEPLDVSVERAAWGIHETINEDVARAFRHHAAERGFDYRRSGMMAFGGSGPVHAARVARKLRVPMVIFPTAAGVMSAVGLLASPLAFELLRSGRVALEDLDGADFEARFAPLIEEAVSQLSAAGVGEDAVAITRRLDMRYRGQGYEIELTLPPGPVDPVTLPDLFAAAYAVVFANSFSDEPLEIVNWKVEVVGPEPTLQAFRLDVVSAKQACKGSRPAYFPEAGGMIDCPVYDRYTLESGVSIEGPVLIEERELTCVVGMGDRLIVDGIGNLMVSTAEN